MITTLAIETSDFELKTAACAAVLLSSAALGAVVGILPDGGDLTVGFGHECLQLFLKQLIRGLGSGRRRRSGTGRPAGILVLVLGTCPTLATTTNVAGAFGMGLAALAVLVCSNILISLLRKIIPDTVRIPCYIVIIAGFVTIVEMIVHAYFPALYEMLGVYLALI